MKKEAYFKMMGLTKLAAEEEEDRKARKAEEKAQRKEDDETSKSERRRHGKWHSEVLGVGTASAIPAGIGALLGGATGNPEAAKLGAIIGLLPQAIGALAGNIAGPRTLAHQQRYNKSTGQTIGNWLVPGMAAFNATRTYLTNDEQKAVLQELLLKKKLEGKI